MTEWIIHTSDDFGTSWKCDQINRTLSFQVLVRALILGCELRGFKIKINHVMFRIKKKQDKLICTSTGRHMVRGKNPM